jgi:dimethylaniline monooxygenase (N-oxide forming)
VSEPDRVCLIGAGASGIAAARALSVRGIRFDWFEARDRIGGIWAFDGDDSSSAYDHLHINVSRPRIEFSDLPMPASYPQYPHHAQLAAYFERYVRHFGLDRRLRLQAPVTAARRLGPGQWEVEAAGRAERYRALVVANGHHSKPRWPQPPPGSFAGEQMHSHDYADDDVLRDRDVVVVGLGNSACDIAVEASMVARTTYLSVRRGAHVLPKVMWRWAYDQVPGLTYALGRGIGIGGLGFQLPWWLRQRWLAAGHRLTVGPMRRYGLPEPRHSFGATHPTISPRLLDRLLHGELEPKPTITRFDGELVHFADGSAARAELIVWCTGYEIELPFLEPGLVPVGPGNQVDLYWNVFVPELSDLAFVGLLQPAAGSTMQIAELQAGWVAAHLAGEYALPPRQEMEAEVSRRRRLAAKRTVATARHTVQVEQFDFGWRLRGEMRRGRRRLAAEAGG